MLVNWVSRQNGRMTSSRKLLLLPFRIANNSEHELTLTIALFRRYKRIHYHVIIGVFDNKITFLKLSNGLLRFSKAPKSFISGYRFKCQEQREPHRIDAFKKQLLN